MFVKVGSDGTIEEWEDGYCRRRYGSGFKAAASDGHVVVALDNYGQIHEFRGASELIYGNDIAAILQVSGNCVVVQGSDGQIHEFRDGCKIRSY